MGKSTRRKGDSSVVQKRIDAQAARLAASLNASLRDPDIPEAEKLRLMVQLAPRPHQLDEILLVDDRLIERGWTRYFGSWEGISWDAPSTPLEDEEIEEIEQRGGTVVTSIATDFSFERPTYYLDPARPEIAGEGRFFASADQLLGQLGTIEMFSPDVEPAPLLELLGDASTERMGDRGCQIAPIWVNSCVPYPDPSDQRDTEAALSEARSPR